MRRYFSLNLYEVKIWTALLARGVATAGELSDIANVPRSRSYDILESLEKKGFVVLKLGKPIKYMVVPPQEVVERVKKNLSVEMNKQIKRLEELKDKEILSELNSLHDQGIDLVGPADMSGSIKGRHNLYNHLEMTIKNAEKSVTIMTTSKGLMRKIEGLKQTFEEVKNRGVSIRIAAPLDEECWDAVKDMQDIAEIRHTKHKARFAIVDGEELLFMVMDDGGVHPTYDLGIWVNTPFFAQALDGLFSMAWETMTPASEIVK